MSDKSKTFDLDLRRTNTIINNIIPRLSDAELRNDNFSYLYYKYNILDEFARITHQVA